MRDTTLNGYRLVWNHDGSVSAWKLGTWFCTVFPLPLDAVRFALRNR